MIITKNENAVITLEEARAIALAEINKIPGIECLLSEQHLEKPYGWCFFYQSKAYLTTGDFRDSLLGNGPILIERETGRMIMLGSDRPVDMALANYEQGLYDLWDLTVIKLRLWHESNRMLAKLGVRLDPSRAASSRTFAQEIEHILDHELPYTFKSQTFLYTYHLFEEIDQTRCFTYNLVRSTENPNTLQR